MNNTTIRVSNGQLRGVNVNNINGKSFIAFRGIPYAKPPIGNLRFKDPEPVESWCDVKDATNFADCCAQRDWITEKIRGTDDCLYLNVYTTTLQSAVPRAVMFWIHGGAFVSGSGDDERWGPDYLIEKDIILVTINYRLGILGFLNINDVEAPGNQGLKDQVQALWWVRENISYFGGDPNNVTIFGQSAGGASVHYLTISPLAQGLFHKAIIQSGVAINSWASVPYAPVQIVQRLAKIVKMNNSNGKDIVTYLRTLDVEHLVELESQIDSSEDKLLLNHGFLPSMDTSAIKPFLPIPVEEAAKAGIKVPCICGYVSHEGLTIVPYLKEEALRIIDKHPEKYLLNPKLAGLLKDYSISAVNVKKYFFGDENISMKTIDKLVEMMSILHFIIGIHKVLEYQINAQPNIPIYLYKFDYNLKNSLMKKFLKTNLHGTSHSDELEFLFYPKLYERYGIELPEHNSTERHLIQRFTELWSCFAMTGNPISQTGNFNSDVVWKPIDNILKYDYLNIAEELSPDIDVNVLYQLQQSISNVK